MITEYQYKKWHLKLTQDKLEQNNKPQQTTVAHVYERYSSEGVKPKIPHYWLNPFR